MMKTVKIVGNKKITTEIVLVNTKGEYLWLFNFKSGGFNEVWAITEREAILKAVDEFNLPVNVDSFRIATEEMRDAQDAMGRSLTC